MTQPFFDHPFLKGHHALSRFEADAPDLFVLGDIPDDLEGVFFRNGAEPLYAPIEGDYHWFDGDGMVFGFYIAGGRVSMRNRWVRTDKFNLEMEAGKRLFGLFGNPLVNNPATADTRYNTGNTNVILHGGKLLALMEGATAMALDPKTLETLGEETYGGAITTTFSAHPTVDQNTGELFNLGAMMEGPGGSKMVRYDIVGRDGSLTKSEYFEAPHLAPMHTFFLTENWVVFPVIPIDVSLERAKKGGPMTAWMPGRSTKLGLMKRYGSADELRWIEMDPRHMFHELNVWEEGDKLIADVAAAEITPLFPDIHGNKVSHADGAQSLRRWEIDLSGKTDAVKETILNGRDIQFPRPDDRRMARKTMHAFANINLHSVDGRADGMDAVLRYNTETGEEDIYHFGNGAAAGELVFAPRKGSSDEADGYALTLVHEADSPVSQLVIFNARDISGGPIARVLAPFRVSSGFHCNYYSTDSYLFEQAMPR